MGISKIIYFFEIYISSTAFIVNLVCAQEILLGDFSKIRHLNNSKENIKNIYISIYRYEISGTLLQMN